MHWKMTWPWKWRLFCLSPRSIDTKSGQLKASFFGVDVVPNNGGTPIVYIIWTKFDKCFRIRLTSSNRFTHRGSTLDSGRDFRNLPIEVLIASMASLTSTGSGMQPPVINNRSCSAACWGSPWDLTPSDRNFSRVSLRLRSVNCRLLARFLLSGKKDTKEPGAGAVSWVNARIHIRLSDSLAGTPQSSNI